MTDLKYMRPGLEFARNKLIEECGELIQALGKTGRWGWDSYDPTVPESERESNELWVVREARDVEHALMNLYTELAAKHLPPLDNNFC
jgi:hypothetical protein